MNATQNTIPVDIATWAGINYEALGIKYFSYGSGSGLFYTEKTEDDKLVPDRYFRLSMKDSVVYVDFYHPEPKPDSSWVNPIIEKYLELAAGRGQVIKDVVHNYRYHSQKWAKP